MPLKLKFPHYCCPDVWAGACSRTRGDEGGGPCSPTVRDLWLFHVVAATDDQELLRFFAKFRHLVLAAEICPSLRKHFAVALSPSQVRL